MMLKGVLTPCCSRGLCPVGVVAVGDEGRVVLEEWVGGGRGGGPTCLSPKRWAPSVKKSSPNPGGRGFDGVGESGWERVVEST